MPTDPLQPVYSAARVRVARNDLNHYTWMASLDEVLQDAGWEVTDSYYATGELPAPFSLPFAVGPPVSPKSEAPCTRFPIIQFNGTAYKYYDPNTEEPATGCASTVWFPLGETPGDTAINFADVFDANYSVDIAEDSGSFIFTITALAPGWLYNTQDVQGSSWFTGGEALGGGFEYESQAPASIYRVQVRGVAISSVSAYMGAELTFVLNGDTTGRVWRLDIPDIDNRFVFMANPHGFAIFDPPEDNHLLQFTSIFAMALEYPDGWYVSDPYAVFVVGEKCFRNSTSTWTTTELALDTAPTYWSNNTGSYPRPLASRSPTNGLVTLANTPLLQGVYMMLAQNRLASLGVVGRLYDCIMLSTYLPPGSQWVAGDNSRYEAISSSIGDGGQTECTLMMRYA